MDSEWTKEIESLCQTWKKSLKRQSRMHERCSSYYSYWNKVVSVPELVCSALLGSMGVVNLTEHENSQALRWYQSILSVFIAILTSVDASLQLNVKQSQHLSSAKAYQKIGMLIDVQLVKKRERREEANAFIDKIVMQMENLKESSPEINSKFREEEEDITDSDDEEVRRSRLAVNLLCD